MNTEIKYFTMPELSDLFYLLNMAGNQSKENTAIQYTGFEQGFNLATTLLLGKDIKEFFGEPTELPEKTQDILGHQLFSLASKRVSSIMQTFEERYSISDKFMLAINSYNYGYIDGKRVERERRRIDTARAEMLCESAM